VRLCPSCGAPSCSETATAQPAATRRNRWRAGGPIGIDWPGEDSDCPAGCSRSTAVTAEQAGELVELALGKVQLGNVVRIAAEPLVKLSSDRRGCSSCSAVRAVHRSRQYARTRLLVYQSVVHGALPSILARVRPDRWTHEACSRPERSGETQIWKLRDGSARRQAKMAAAMPRHASGARECFSLNCRKSILVHHVESLT